MSRGGKRDGAGRKKNSLTIRTRETAEKATATGVTPLEVMLDNMRFYHATAEAALNKLLQGKTPAEVLGDEPSAPKPDAGDPPANLVDVFRWMLNLRGLSGKEAERAAPFMHPRIAPSEAKDPRDEETVPLAERLAAYERDDAIAESEGKVVKLTKTKAGK